MIFPSQSPSSRRVFLAGILATIAGPVCAGGDGSSGLTKNPKVKSAYTQSEFSRLSRNEINQIYFNYTQKRYTLIRGFTLVMSGHLILMARSQRRRLGRLIREMKDIKDKQKRLERLRKELQWADDQLHLLKDALQRAKAKNSEAAIEETEMQLVLINWYRDGLRAWIGAPGEGQR